MFALFPERRDVSCTNTLRTLIYIGKIHHGELERVGIEYYREDHFSLNAHPTDSADSFLL